MKTPLILIALCLPLTAQADKTRMPADAPPAYQSECGGCHVAFPPGLLSAEDWQQVMQRLDKHYGDNAVLDEATRRTIEAFLVRNAGSVAKIGAGRTARADEPPRLTRTPWFQRKHREVAQADWNHPQVGSPANCAACHTRAAQGSYREREIVMPSGRRWERD